MFKTRIPEIIADLEPRLNAAAAVAAELIAVRAKERVPVATGKLRDAIHVEHSNIGEYAVVAGSHDVFYGHIVEHGGSHTPAHPFMIPALEESRSEILAASLEAFRGL